MKTLDYYRERILYASPIQKERYLAEAFQCGQFSGEELDALVELAAG